MCGLFGGFGKPSPSIIRGLAIANRDRGIDSLGFFDSQGRIAKHAGDPPGFASGLCQVPGERLRGMVHCRPHSRGNPGHGLQ